MKKNCNKFAVILSTLILLGTCWQTCSLAATDTVKQSTITADKLTTPALPTNINEFAQYVEKTRQQWQIPGIAIAIVQNDKIIFAKGFGVKKLGSSDAVDPHTIFEIGSMSKAFTSALVAAMIDEKKFTWQDRVIDLYPDFRMYDPWVTREFLVKDLMAQHSGLVSHAGDGQTTLGFDRNHVIHSLRYIKPISSFRSEYAYQNSLFLVAAALVEKYSGISWEDNIKQRLFVPLQMTESSCTSKDFKAAKNVAYLHIKYQNKVIPIPMMWNSYFDWLDTYGPAGSINSNIIDLSNWLIFQENNGKFADKQIISEKNIDFTHTPQTSVEMPHDFFGDEKIFYAAGWVYDAYQPSPIIWHTGGTSGASTIISIAPQNKVGIIILTNLGGIDYPLMMSRTFFDMYFHKQNKDWNKMYLAKKNEQDKKIILLQSQKPPKDSTAALPLTKYIGTYKSDIYGKLMINIENGKLMGTLGLRPIIMQLTPWNRDIFKITWLGEKDEIPTLNLEPNNFITFNLDADGNTKAAIIEVINSQDNTGTFEKID